MNIDELKRSLATMADEADESDHGGAATRLDGIDHKVSRQRRMSVLATGLAAAVAVAAVVGVPAVLDRSDHRTPLTDHSSSLPTLVDHGTAIYTSPAGDRLIGHGVATPGERVISFTFTPTTLDLNWEQFCWDPAVRPRGHGADYSTSVNGHPLTSSTCQDAPGTDPVDGTSTFGDTPTSNANGWSDLGVEVGKPSTFMLRISGHADRGVAPQLGAVVYENGPRLETDGVWYDQQVVYKGHTYEAVAAKASPLERDGHTTLTVELPQSDHQIYVYTGAQHVRGGMLLGSGSQGLIQLGKGVTGGGSGDLVRLGKASVTVVANTKDPRSTGTIYALVYVQVD